MKVSKKALRFLPVILLFEILTQVLTIAFVGFSAGIAEPFGTTAATVTILTLSIALLAVWITGSAFVYGIMELSRQFRYSWYLHIAYFVIKVVALVFDSISAGKARDADIIIVDTAGRLHNKKHLMEELAKIYRVIDRELPYSDREVLLVLDATTGQNAVNQAREFLNVAEITGIILTKLDGTARGGVVLNIKNDLKVPVKFIGVGEQIDDLQPFSPQAFAQSLFDVEMPDHSADEAPQEEDA